MGDEPIIQNMTWVPPAYRQPGEVPPPKNGAWLPWVGALATGLAIGGAVFVTEIVSWMDSVCGNPAPVIASQRGALRLHLMIVWCVAAGAPLLVAGVARARAAIWLPWAVAACAMVGVGVGMALTAEPPTWCLF